MDEQVVWERVAPSLPSTAAFRASVFRCPRKDTPLCTSTMDNLKGGSFIPVFGWRWSGFASHGWIYIPRRSR